MVKKIILFAVLIVIAAVFHREIYKSVSFCLNRVSAKCKSWTRPLSESGGIVRDLGPSLKTIKGINAQTRKQEKMLNEIMPEAGGEKPKGK
jgi:hypothetical protein